MAERLCQKRALETFQLDPEKWGGEHFTFLSFFFLLNTPITDPEFC